jgi:transglutaminase-like putative cysteine protease
MLDALSPTPTVDSDHPAIISFAEASASGARDSRERAVNLYYAVRDGVRYDPYSLEMTVHGLRASTTLEARRGWCVPKAILLAACCRALEIPARLGFDPFDLEGRQHMEYLRFHDEYDDLPLDEIMASYAKHYSGALYEAPRGDFDREVEEETRNETS